MLTKFDSGGGVSGLTLAVTLGQHSQIPIDIYESASEIGTIGAGLAVWKRSWDIMCRLGLDAEMDKRFLPRPSEGKSEFGDDFIFTDKVAFLQI